MEAACLFPIWAVKLGPYSLPKNWTPDDARSPDIEQIMPKQALKAFEATCICTKGGAPGASHLRALVDTVGETTAWVNDHYFDELDNGYVLWWGTDKLSPLFATIVPAGRARKDVGGFCQEDCVAILMSCRNEDCESELERILKTLK